MTDTLEIRYVNESTGAVYPDIMFDLHSCPPGIRREVSHGEDEQGNTIWKELRDKPRPGIELQQRGERGDNFEPVAMFDSLTGQDALPEDTRFVESYDTYVNSWESDTSGGPSNFHGNGGGDDNPTSSAETKHALAEKAASAADWASQLPSNNEQ